jgi:succinate dehydrogenase/fumarate reductase flavoprotein subunit
MMLNAKIPEGPLEKKWQNYQTQSKLINPANKKKMHVIVVGSGLSGAGAAATLAELGYEVQVFCYQDSARRAHSVAAQGGINAAKNYQHDGDSVWRMFYDTLKGGDFRSREANTYRLAELSAPADRPLYATGRTLRKRIRRRTGQSQFWRGAGTAYILRPRADRAAAPAGRLLSAL